MNNEKCFSFTDKAGWFGSFFLHKDTVTALPKVYEGDFKKLGLCVFETQEEAQAALAESLRADKAVAKLNKGKKDGPKNIRRKKS